MTSSALIDLSDADWRDPDGVLARARKANPGPHGIPCDWSALLSFSGPGTRDNRSAIRIYQRLGLHPILLYGLNDDGSCMCWKGAKCGRSSGKHPRGKDWESLPLDVEAIDRALEENHRWNLGLRMGRQPDGSNLVAIDVDGPLSLLEPLEAKRGRLPATLTARTGSSGTHLVFRVSDQALGRIKNKVKLADGVDVRSTGGQIVAAPSRHYSGNFYEWIDAREPAVLG